jgi:glyoxylase-like metal-dependent hydrolase (beta-lactamase superfamily II)
MEIRDFYDPRTGTFTYVVHDSDSRDAVIIDPVLDYEPVGSKLWTESLDRVIAFVREQALKVHYILETHAHADHLSGAQRLKQVLPDAQIAIGENITVVQQIFSRLFRLGDDFATDGSQFDRLLKDGETVTAGSLEFVVIFTPGHTPACASYRFGDTIFTGDALFMPDSGTGRCDFPAGSARDMYHSIQRLYRLPDDTRVFVGHDYQPGGREVKNCSTIGEQKRHNIHLRADTTEDEFVRFRQHSDSKLDAPRLLYPSIQVNINAGEFPLREDGTAFLKIPVNFTETKEPAEKTPEKAA